MQMYRCASTAQVKSCRAYFPAAYMSTRIDTTAPQVSSAAVADAAPTIVVLTFDETPVANALSAADFAVAGVGGGTAAVPSAASIVGDTIELMLSTTDAVNNGDSVTVNYTPSGTSGQDVADAAGNTLIAFTGQAVTNNVVAAAAGVCQQLFYCPA